MISRRRSAHSVGTENKFESFSRRTVNNFTNIIFEFFRFSENVLNYTTHCIPKRTGDFYYGLGLKMYAIIDEDGWSNGIDRRLFRICLSSSPRAGENRNRNETARGDRKFPTYFVNTTTSGIVYANRLRFPLDRCRIQRRLAEVDVDRRT